MLKLRRVTPKDSEQILRISRASFLQPWPKSEFEKYSEFFVAEENGQIMGFVVGKISENQGVVKLIAVSPNYQGKGIGKKLIEYILNHFTEKKAKEVIARSRINNEAGCSFLKSFGFEVVKTIGNYYLNDESAYLMIKKL